MARMAHLLGGLTIAFVSAGSVPAQEIMRQYPMNDLSDGVEVNRSAWYCEGVPGYSGNLAAGRAADGSIMEPAAQFLLPGYFRGDSVAYASLRFSSLGGAISDTLRLGFRGIYFCSTTPFGPDRRPSQFPAGRTAVSWRIGRSWIYGGDWNPLYVDGPDIAPVVNEILSSTLWPEHGHLSGSLALWIQLEDPGPHYERLCRFADSGSSWHPMQLLVCRALADAFLALPLAGQVTDRSVAINFAHRVSLDCYVAYGPASGDYRWAQGADRTELPVVDPRRDTEPGRACTVRLDQLDRDATYYYRLFYRRAGRTGFESTDEFTFHTQRGPDGSFVFDLMSDAHLEDLYDGLEVTEDQAPGGDPGGPGAGRRGGRDIERDLTLYRTALDNVTRDSSDFLINLGDFALNLQGGSNLVRTAEEARRIYADERTLMGEEGCARPFYLVLGNHEAELGWLDDGSGEGPFVWSGRARKEFVPNPGPDSFYSGNDRPDDDIGDVQDYYSWEWGNALFMVLDPFRSTTVKPHRLGGPGSGDGWDWTIGSDQYDWLVRVLAASQRRWKFVFIHHLVGGVVDPDWGPYGRGGIESARFAVDGRPSFEWGGEDAEGTYALPLRRPGFQHGSLHELFVHGGVTAVFHAHDHCFWHQELDGIVYQECPLPSSARYGSGLCSLGGYLEGDSRPNSGHLRVTVRPEAVKVEYVRAFLPGDGENGAVEFTYEVSPPSVASPLVSAPPAGPRIRVGPMPGSGALRVQCLRPWSGPARLTLYNLEGRVLAELDLSPAATGGTWRWNLTGPEGRRLPSGVYSARWSDGRESETHRVLVIL